MDPNGKVALITGGARIGQVVADALANRGCSLSLTYRDSRDAAEKTAGAAKAAGVKAAVLRADGQGIIEAISAGRRVSQAPVGRILPPLVIAGIDLAASRNDLPQGLRTLSRLYEEQAEFRLGTVEAILSAIVIIFMGFMVAILTMAMVAPLISLISSVSSPHH